MCEMQNKQIQNLRSYFHERAEGNQLYEVIAEADKNITVLKLADRNYFPEEIGPNEQTKIESWRRKELHGRYPAILRMQDVDINLSCAWLCNGNIFAETEGFMIAIQDQVVPTMNYRKFILKQNVDCDKCRLCRQKTENIEHITSSCSVLAPVEYTKRHDNVAKVIHQQLCKMYGGSTEIKPYYVYEPNQVIETSTAKIYWNRSIITDHHVANNRPDIVVVEKETRNTFLVDVAIPLGSNMGKKYSEKISKYFPLANEIKEMWDQEKVSIIPVIIGATGEIPKSLLQSLHQLNLPENLINELQKIVVIETCGIVRKVLNSN
jgi:hypothetical protein